MVLDFGGNFLVLSSLPNSYALPLLTHMQSVATNIIIIFIKKQRDVFITNKIL